MTESQKQEQRFVPEMDFETHVEWQNLDGCVEKFVSWMFDVPAPKEIPEKQRVSSLYTEENVVVVVVSTTTSSSKFSSSVCIKKFLHGPGTTASTITGLKV